LASVCPHELCRIPGIGEAGATALAAAIELGRRLGRVGLPWAEPLRCPSDVAGFVRAHLRGSTQEVFLAIGLDARQRVRLVRRVAMGSLAQVEVHPRELFRPLVRAGMHCCLLAHNHPSGSPEPSAADLELTRRMVDVGRLLGIPVLDHLVVTQDDSVSLAAVGLMPA
jgi:DNA repair protein RadC